ncbi:MAG TPA: hypothetical protein VGZ00_08320, partial [Candidatus Baltobacteraceae bacterium]|nr:hypothetical protein [Candidatus Baltobacteraceae bacterium]
MKHRNGKPADGSSSGQKATLPDIHGICSAVLTKHDIKLGFEMLDKLYAEIYLDDVCTKAISAKQNRDIVDTFANLGARFAGEGQRSSAALCFATAARITVSSPDLERKIIPFLNQALEFSDFFNADEDSRLANVIGTVSEKLALRGIPFVARNEPEKTKYDEARISYSMTKLKRKGGPIISSTARLLVDGYNMNAMRHLEAGREQKAAYWFENAALLATKIPNNEDAYYFWYMAGRCNDRSKSDNLTETSRCFLNALASLPRMQKPDKAIDPKAFEYRIESLKDMG